MAAPWWQIDWVWIAAGAILGVTGLALLLWALLWDRARGRRRCPKCWYDMSAVQATQRDEVTAWVCPECGRVSKRERRLLRTRRRWRWALLALLVLCAGGGAFLRVAVYRNGWWSLMPTWALIDVYPLSGRNGPFGTELFKRLGYGGGGMWTAPIATEEDLRYLLRRIRHGNVFAKPGSSWWKASYGQIPRGSFIFDLGFASHADDPRFASRMPETLVSDLKRLYELPLYVEFQVRDPWPSDAPLYVAVEALNPWPWPTGSRVVARRKDTGETVFNGGEPGFLVRSPPAGGQLELDYDVYQLRQSEKGANWKMIEQRSATVPFRIRGSLAEQIRPVVDASIDQMVAGITYQVGAGIMVDVRPTQTLSTDGIGFGVIMEHQLGGVTLYRERVWWKGGKPDDPMRFDYQREWIGGTRNAWMATPGEKWTIHIVSDAETALRVTDAKQYWAGQADITVTNRAR